MSVSIDIVIDPNAKGGPTVEFEVQGMSGSKCTELTSALAKGHDVQEEKLTDNFYAPELLPVSTSE